MTTTPCGGARRHHNPWYPSSVDPTQALAEKKSAVKGHAEATVPAAAHWLENPAAPLSSNSDDEEMKRWTCGLSLEEYLALDSGDQPASWLGGLSVNQFLENWRNAEPDEDEDETDEPYEDLDDESVVSE